MKGIFITGTDTGVGKTVVTATLCRILRNRGIDAVALKPFATGIGPNTNWKENDPLILSAAMGYIETAETVSPVRLLLPLSPYDAARLTGAKLEMETILLATRKAAARHAFAIIEGVGGVSVPLTEKETIADFAAQLNIPVVVVARSAVGTINHTLLTIAALRHKNIGIKGVVFSRAAQGELTLEERAGTETAARLGRVHCYGLVQRSPKLMAARDPDEFARALPVEDTSINNIADSLVADLT